MCAPACLCCSSWLVEKLQVDLFKGIGITYDHASVATGAFVYPGLLTLLTSPTPLDCASLW